MDGDVAHFVLVPFMAQGHMIPTVDFGRVLAERGMLVSLITTPFNLSRFQSTVDRINQSGLPFDFVPLRFPTEEVGLPEGFENVDVMPLPSPDSPGLNDGTFHKFYKAINMLTEPLEAYIRQKQLKNPEIPTIMITDFCHPWTRKVSEKLGVPRYVFYSVCCFTLNLAKMFQQGEYATSKSGAGAGAVFVVPDLDQRIEVARPSDYIFFTSPENEYIRSDIKDSEDSADGIVVNTFYELEPMFIDRYSKMTGKDIWPVGPVSLCNKETVDKAIRGAKSLVDGNKILEFLDSMDPKSVVYFSLGSITRLSEIQLKEIGKGLEATGHPFIWVIRYMKDESAHEIEEWLKNDGLEERTKTRSLIIRGWAPQMMILSHASTGAFFTHCGWNSSLEGIAAGIPMITWPCFADQFSNESFVVDVAKTGVTIGVKESVFLQKDTVKRETIKKAVERAMYEGEEGEERRKRAVNLRDAAKTAFDVGGSSHANTSLFLRKILKSIQH